MVRLLAAALAATFFCSDANAHDMRRGMQTVRAAEISSLEAVNALKLTPQAHRALFSIVRRDSVWPEKKITVCFGPQNDMAARQGLIEKIISIAEEWTTGTKVAFDWGHKPYRLCESHKSASIRVNISAPANEADASFQSLVGNQAKISSIEGLSPYSMTLQFPEASAYFGRDEVMRFYVLHEFGHALGFEHEHQRIDCDYNWSYIASHFNFANEQEAKDNMAKIFGSTVHAYPDNEAVIDGEFITTKYDNYSVMKYNLSTSARPDGDDPKIYREGEHSKCYRKGWVSKLTKFDRAGMAKAYSQPLIPILTIARNLQDLAAPNNVGVRKRLTDPRLGRAEIGSAAVAARRNAIFPSGLLPDEEREVSRDIEILRGFPGAIDLLKKILAERQLPESR